MYFEEFSGCIIIAWCELVYQEASTAVQSILIGHGFDFFFFFFKSYMFTNMQQMHREAILTAWSALVLILTYLLQDMLLKRAADIAEALYSVPRPHSQLQALPSSPAHGSVMGLGSYPSQLGVSIGEPGQSSQGKQNDILSEAHSFPDRSL